MTKNTLNKIKHKTRIRTRYKSINKKVKAMPYIYRSDGARGIAAYFKGGIKKRLRKKPNISHAGDVLFVSIDEPLLDRYRTDHMIESLESVGMSVGKVFYYDLTPEHIKNYNVFIFYRCPWMPGFKKMFEQIKKTNKVSIYAVDDLVIDKKYTDTIPVVQAMLSKDRALYDDGVKRHNKLMSQCDYAITTTQCLSDELRNYKNLKEVYIDRNSMSDEMVYHSNKAIKEVVRDDEKIIIGYFSGTATHNEDFEMITPALLQVLEEHDNVFIKLVGKIDVPEAFKGYEDRLIFMPYVDWRVLPSEVRKCHITLSPLVDSLFNRAKSEIKWAESALVEVPVVASNMGAFKDSVKNNLTGMLVENTDQAWYEAICSLVEGKEKRNKIGVQSRQYVLKHYRTTGHRAMELQRFIRSITPKIIAFGGVSFGAISGGNMVVKKHIDILRAAGHIVYGVESFTYHDNDSWQKLNKEDDKNYEIFRINSKRATDKVNLQMSFDRFVATFWASVDMVDRYRYISKNGKKLYLVQNMEADFYDNDDEQRRKVLATYHNTRLEPITISKWCQSWLKDDFGRNSKYAPNGIDIDKFTFSDRAVKNRKIKVLIEGDSASDYKRVDESFKIANKLDPARYEVSYMSYNAPPKSWYKVINVYMKVPYDKVADVYAEHDILIKSSMLESFSYPPLELMATGGVPVLVKNDGNAEYVVDGENAIYYATGSVSDALHKIEELCSDEQGFKKIAKNGRQTAESRAWDTLSKQIVDLYE